MSLLLVSAVFLYIISMHDPSHYRERSHVVRCIGNLSPVSMIQEDNLIKANLFGMYHNIMNIVPGYLNPPF